jgi:hypothetical protein
MTHWRRPRRIVALVLLFYVLVAGLSLLPRWHTVREVHWPCLACERDPGAGSLGPGVACSGLDELGQGAPWVLGGFVLAALLVAVGWRRRLPPAVALLVVVLFTAVSAGGSTLLAHLLDRVEDHTSFAAAFWIAMLLAVLAAILHLVLAVAERRAVSSACRAGRGNGRAPGR